MHGPVTIFDLRQETHIFVNGLPVSWFATRDWANVGRSQTEIEEAEAVWAQSLGPGSEIAVRPGKPVKKGDADSAVVQQVIVKEASIERDLVSSAGTSYVRSPLRTIRDRSMTRSIDLLLPFVRFRRMPGRIFTAKPDLDERPHSWCCTTCSEMRLVYL